MKMLYSLLPSRIPLFCPVPNVMEGWGCCPGTQICLVWDRTGGPQLGFCIRSGGVERDGGFTSSMHMPW